MPAIVPFPLEGFEKLLPLLLRCFPEFWEERLGRNLYSFPYDVELFALQEKGEIIGTIGLHPYCFYGKGQVIKTAGISDVCVDPPYRGKGYSKMLLSFGEKMAEMYYPSAPFLSLYTDKPGVYHSSSYKEYFSNTSTEIKEKDLPRGNGLSFSHILLDLPLLRGERVPEKEEEKMAVKIMEIYNRGNSFPGKCLRTPKFWQELFAEPSYSWLLEEGEKSYFLFKGKEVYEGYSTLPDHQTNFFTPKHGGHNGNFLMLKKREEKMALLQKEVEEGLLVFPIADTF